MGWNRRTANQWVDASTVSAFTGPAPAGDGSGVRPVPAHRRWPRVGPAVFPLVTRRSPRPVSDDDAPVDERLFDAFLGVAAFGTAAHPWDGMVLATRLLQRLVPSDVVFGSLYDIDDDVLRVVAADARGPIRPDGRTLRTDEGLVAIALRDRQPPVRFVDGAGDTRFGTMEGGHLRFARNAIYMPLRADDQLMGLLHMVNRRREGPFSEADASVVQYVGERLAEFLHDASLAMAMPGAP